MIFCKPFSPLLLDLSGGSSAIGDVLVLLGEGSGGQSNRVGACLPTHQRLLNSLSIGVCWLKLIPLPVGSVNKNPLSRAGINYNPFLSIQSASTVGQDCSLIDIDTFT
jgi:hypothetical protein